MSIARTERSNILPNFEASGEPDSSQENQTLDKCVYQAPKPSSLSSKSTSWQDTALKAGGIFLKVIFFWVYFPLRRLASYCLLPAAFSTRFESANEAAQRREQVEATIAQFAPFRNLKPMRCSFKTPDNVQIDGLLFEPKHSNHPRPKAIIYLCSNNSNFEEIHRDFVETLSCHPFFGTAVLFFNYRGVGDSEGSPDINKLPLDAYSAYEYLINEKGYAPKDIAFYGYSMGGGVGPIAADLVQQQHPDSLLGGVSVCSFSSLSQAAQEFCFAGSIGAGLIKALGVDLRVKESWEKLKGPKHAINTDEDPIIGLPAALASSTGGIVLQSDQHYVPLNNASVEARMISALDLI